MLSIPDSVAGSLFHSLSVDGIEMSLGRIQFWRMVVRNGNDVHG